MVRRLLVSLALAAFAGAVSVGGASPAVAVVGGSPIQIQSAPWTVLVRSGFSSHEEDCTGSVIDASHILTAAHCLYDDDGSLVQPASVGVVAGVSNFVSPSPTDLEQSRSVSSLRVHPGYVFAPNTVAVDDVAVLALATPLDLSGAAVKAVALPASGAPFPAQAVVSIAGYGLEDPTAPAVSGALESMTARVDWQGECVSALYDIIRSDNGVELCDVSLNSAACNGDSGAALVNTNGAPTVVGVVNGTPPGCPVGSDAVAIYVGAPEILSFIEGDDQPPTAPRVSTETTAGLAWAQPLVAGGALTCSTGGWPAAVQIAYSFLDVASGDVLQTGPDPIYRLPAAAAGQAIFCEVAATNGGGTTVAYTTASPTIERAPQVTIERPAPLVGKPGHSVTLHVVLESQPGLSGTFSVCALPPASVGAAGACAVRHEQFGASGRFPFSLVLRIKSTAPPGIAHITISATAGISKARTTALLRIAKR